MAPAAAPPPIVGTSIDPPPKEMPAFAAKLDRTTVGGIGYRAMRRYSLGNVGLLANGTAYYLFLSLFALLAFAYGIIAILGADQLSATMTEALNNAFPGVVGDEGIDPATLQSAGRTAGIIGLAVLLYSTPGAVNGASSSLHLIFGAPPDPRTFVKAKARHLLILVCVAPLILISFAASAVASQLADPVLETLGWNGSGARTALTTGGLVLGFLVDVLILWILLGHLGGIRPHRRPRLVASLGGAVALGLVKALLEAIMSWALDKPQYGAFAAPIAVLFILQLLSLVLYASACVAAGISDADVPLEELEPRPGSAPEPPAGA
ncbi:MAG TPA: YhjD/YihY/BrkB family envelope integrity protein [Dermatophilaceae bacterium]|nr:YhjD/YihY/BrkB family envelope integrity protein [Dermatophilaceae bacterium]